MNDCPQCGKKLIFRKHGAYCSCGFSLSKVFGHSLNQAQIQSLINKGKVLIKNTSDKTKSPYSLFVKADGVEEYTYKDPDGNKRSGYRLKLSHMMAMSFEPHFPDDDDAA